MCKYHSVYAHLPILNSVASYNIHLKQDKPDMNRALLHFNQSEKD